MRLFISIFFVFIASLAQAQIYKGGNGSGFTTLSPTTLVLSVASSGLYNGGNGNGFVNTSQAAIVMAAQEPVYSGGNGDGFSYSSLTALLMGIADSMYNGGVGKGETIIGVVSLSLNACGVTITWTGNTSTDWSEGGNWDCGVAPGPQNHVVITSGRPRYPIVFANAHVKSVLVQNGATLTVRPSVQLKLGE